MHGPKPVFVLFILQCLALLALAGWWCSLPSGERLRMLAVVMVKEQVATVPPDGLWAQGEWLYGHRATRLKGMAGLVVVAVVIGMGEGIARRRRDPYGGFLLKWWTSGVIGAVLVSGVIAGYLLVPWAMQAGVVACGMGGLVGIIGYALLSGRPYIP
jgi:Ca2+/H+ antiporter